MSCLVESSFLSHCPPQMVLGTPGSLDHTVGTAALEEDMQLKKPKMLIKWKDAKKKKTNQSCSSEMAFQAI